MSKTARRTFLFGAVAAVPALTAGTFAWAQAARTVRDAAGRDVRVGEGKRILSIGGDVTEIIYALGAADRIIAIDRNSTFPLEAKSKPNVGLRTQLSAEGVLAVKPDLILMSENSGPASTLDVLKQAGIPMVLVPQKYSGAGIADKIKLIAAAIGKEPQGAVLSARVLRQFASVANIAASVPAARRKKVIFTHSIARNTVAAAAGHDTPADAIITLAGGVNSLSAIDGIKPASSEAVAAAAPDVILMAVNSDGSRPAAADVFAVPAIQTTPAAKTKALILLEGPFMLGFGPRTAEAVRDLAVALYPDLKFPIIPQ